MQVLNIPEVLTSSLNVFVPIISIVYELYIACSFSEKLQAMMWPGMSFMMLIFYKVA